MKNLILLDTLQSQVEILLRSCKILQDLVRIL